MFSNLTKEIILYSMIPVIVIVLIDLLLLLLMKKKKDDEKFRFNYLIEISLIIAIAVVLPLITGYTIWVIESFWKRGILFNNFAYVVLIIFLSLCLLTLIIWTYLKLLRLTGNDDIKKDDVKEATA